MMKKELSSMVRFEPARARAKLEKVLEKTGGDVTAAAEKLGVHRTLIYQWLRVLGCTHAPARARKRACA